ncbi:50S ribosomal protein L25 [Desulfococcus sp.]|uniref:50S ribosomal protein L25 n=1 Tax=Desulfococcus sp. TaxID=2025834 RepID=UPI003D0D748F
MEFIDLKANIRTGRKKGPSRRLRAAGRIPAVLYGPGAETLALSIDTTDLEKAVKHRSGSQVFLNLVIDSADGNKTAMIKDLQIHPVSRDMIHADFYEIAMDRKIRATSPVTVTGKSIGVENGGMVQIIRRELEVLCYPNQMPEEIVIDITDLDIGDSIHIEDIPVEEGIEFPHEVNFTVLTILSGRPEEAGEEEEEELGEETEAPEQIDEEE